jgi:hypothetical protein
MGSKKLEKVLQLSERLNGLAELKKMLEKDNAPMWVTILSKNGDYTPFTTELKRKFIKVVDDEIVETNKQIEEL